MTKIVLFGTGQAAQVAKFFIDEHGPDQVVGFTVDGAYKQQNQVQGLPVVAWEELESAFSPEDVRLLGPLSYSRMNELRRDRHIEGLHRGYCFTSFVHPRSYVCTTEIGENCFILDHNVIHPFTKIGNGVVMWSNNHIAHHATIGDYCFLSSQIGIAGGCTIEERCYLAGQCGVERGLTIGAGSYIGSGSFVRRSLAPNSVVRPLESKLAPFPADRLKRFV
jgi:sugar O-acyltransferase (sialic acid O-acetyltransferase NeuD family)